MSSVDEMPDPKEVARQFATLLEEMGFGKTPDILPVDWHMYFTIHCPSCQAEFYWKREDTDPIDRHVWCPNERCVQHHSLYTVRVTPYNVTVVGWEPRIAEEQQQHE